MLAEKYGWTIEYIMKLTRQQLKALMEGESEILEFQKDAKKEYGSGENVGDKKGNKGGSGLYELMSLPGMKLSDKARNKINKIMKQKIKKKE